MENNFNVWEGVYKDFKEANGSQEVFNCDKWQQRLVDRLKSQRIALNSNSFIPKVAVTKDYPLPIIISLLQSKLKKIKILDFGGGMGSNYIETIASISEPEKLEYHIVEMPAIYNNALNELKEYKNLHFHENLPKDIKEFDCVHIASTLHYIENWQKLIKDLTKYNPQYFILADLPAGDIPSFVTNQNYYGSKIPSWFWNIRDILDCVTKYNYNLIYKIRYMTDICGITAELPTSNLPKEYRLDYACHLIFERSE